MATETSFTHGRYTHGIPYRSGNQWYRKDGFVLRGDLDSGETIRHVVHGPDDDSRPHIGEYRSECNCCYLGIAHSEFQHNHEVNGGN